MSVTHSWHHIPKIAQDPCNTLASESNARQQFETIWGGIVNVDPLVVGETADWWFPSIVSFPFIPGA